MGVVPDEPASSDEGEDGAEGKFEELMKQSAVDFAHADADGDMKLDFPEFRAMVLSREKLKKKEMEDDVLWARFCHLDADHSGKVDVLEYLAWALRDALRKSKEKVLNLFRKWDSDGSGSVDKKEFHQALEFLGFGMTRQDSDTLFQSFDPDGSGDVDYRELNKSLRRGVTAKPRDPNAKPPKMPKMPEEYRNLGALKKKPAQEEVIVDAAPVPVPVQKSGPCYSDDLTDEQFREISECFDIIDSDASGAISYRELRSALKLLGLKASKEEIKKMVLAVDTDKSGEIEFPEFLAMMTATLASNNSRRGLEKIFRLYDTEGKGRITVEVLRRVSLEMGDELDDEELQGMIAAASNGKRHVSIDDFCVYMSRRADPNAMPPLDDDDDDNEYNDFIQLGERVEY